MERVTTLIQKLQQQLQQKANASQLLTTVQMLQAELLSQQSTSDVKGSDKVMVVIPGNFLLQQEIEKKDVETIEKKLPPIEVEEKVFEILQVDEKEIEEELEEIKRNAAAKNKLSSQAKPFLLFDPIEDVPTLTQQTTSPNNIKEINNATGNAVESLNDKLNQNKTELSDKLTDGPLKDIKKGIGVNDRFLFINELFRGDEAMYERSIKTINNFSIFPEAEYWIKRELKLKIGWNENDIVVKQFDQLVRRRFS